MQRQRLVVRVDQGHRGVGNAALERIPLAVLIAVTPDKTLNPVLIRHVGGIANQTRKDIAREPQLGLHRSDLNRLSNLGSQDRNLKVQIDRISIGGLDRGPRPCIDSVFDPTDLVEGDVVLRPRGVSIRECLNRSTTAEGIRIEKRVEATCTFKL